MWDQVQGNCSRLLLCRHIVCLLGREKMEWIENDQPEKKIQR